MSSVNIIDGLNGTLIDRIATADGPSKVLFSPDGLTAYVNHIRAPLISVVDGGWYAISRVSPIHSPVI